MSKIRFKLGLRVKSILIAFFCITIFVAVFIFYIIPQQDQDDMREIKRYTQNQLETLALVTISPLLKKQYAALYEQLESQLHKNPQWKSLSLITASGLIIYPLSPIEKKELLQHEISIEADIVFLDETLGTLHLIADISTELNSRHRMYYQKAQLLIIIIFLLLVIILLFIEKIITRPLISLTRAFTSLSKQNYRFKLTYKSSDEIGYVINEFRRMSGKLHDHQIETDRLHHAQKMMLETIQESEQHLTLYREQSPIATIEWDVNGKVIDWNKTAEKVFGYTKLEAQGRNYVDFIRSDNLECKVVWQQVMAQSGLNISIYKNLTKDGKIIICEWHNTVLKDNLGTTIGLATLVIDITQRKQNEEKLQLSAQVFNQSHEGIIITDPEGIITDVNPMFSEITGYLPEDSIGKTPHILYSGKHKVDFFATLWDSLNKRGHWQGQIWNKKKNGELYAQITVITSLFDSDGNLLHYVGSFSDITDSMKQQELLENLAHYDPLTHLPNRTLFIDRFNQAIKHSKRDKTLLVVCFLDLDRFKPVNDTYGHKAGDTVLVEVAHRITQCIREQDTVSRLGGDEFALLLGDIRSVEQCKQTMMRIHQTLKQAFIIDGKAVHIGASSGMTIYPHDYADPDTLLRHADQAMYLAKQAGRDQYALFDMTKAHEVTEKQTKLEAIEMAYNNNEFCLYYQPKVNMKSGDIFGVEALIRWNHPERGILSPIEFLPDIEESDLEIRIGNWVMEAAIKQLKLWNLQNIQLEVSINISPFHLYWHGFFEQLNKTLAQYPEALSHQLQLEILESSVLGDINTINNIIINCRSQLGVHCALDDFGTGYSSLAHFRQLQVESIKIDRSFVKNILDNLDDYRLVKGIIELTHSFNRRIIAEGVESAEQGELLMLLNCFDAQGYGIAKPMSADKIVQWINDFHPYPEWLYFGSDNFSRKQALMNMIRTINTSWLNQIVTILQSDENTMLNWPNMNSKKCVCSHLIKIAIQEGFFDISKRDELSLKNEERYVLAQRMKELVNKGDTKQALLELPALYSIHQDIENAI